MTLGQKLSCYRKLSGLTQQQLGERLNISAQAISKWEKDLTEPALATLRALAELYKTSVDELLDPESHFSDPKVLSMEEESSAQEENTSAAIGFCKRCGILVNEENLGASQPTVLCKACLEKEQKEKQRRQEQQKQERERAEAVEKSMKAYNRKRRKRHLVLSLCVAGVAAAIFLIVNIINMVNAFQGSLLVGTVIGTYVVFSFICCLFHDCAVQDVVLDWMAKSFQAPGLITTFDIDGCLWYIGMKLLFWAIGLVFAVVVGIIGITIGLIIAPFVFPYVMNQERLAILDGSELI